jgi:alkanesulfonate monooxygenase SsuD/methylene tetrahydromethanopterin reductase-like flavin-dependent oxidoreductase (luciferase family)
MSILRFNFAAPQDDPTARRGRVQAALELSSWSETRGVDAVSVDEHHQSGHGWSCNPILTAAVFLARTTQLVASVDCALGPLWHPVRLAEDIALVDTQRWSPDRHDRPRLPASRIRVVRNAIRTARAADGRTPGEADVAVVVVHVHPGPLTRPHPTVFVGGSVRATAERAARYGLPLNLPSHLPELADYYRQLCAESGHTPIVVMPAERSRGMVFLHEDPDRAWAELGEHYLWEARVYSGWGAGQVHSFMHGTETIETVDDVRAAGRYRFMAPEQLVADIKNNPRDPVVLHPLVGAMPIDEAWKSVQLLTDEVLPVLSSTTSRH